MSSSWDSVSQGSGRRFVAEEDENLKAAIQSVMEDPEVGILVLDTADFERIPVRLRTTLENSIRPTVVAIGGEEGGDVPPREDQEIGGC